MANMQKADEYRARARECLERAREFRDLDVKRQFENAARQWFMMADQMERLALSWRA
jgi:hypothetical protein